MLMVVAAVAAGMTVWALWVPGAAERLARLEGPGRSWSAWLSWLGARWLTGPRARRRRELADDLPRAASLLASALAAGAPLRGAMAEVAEVSPPATAALLEGLLAQVAIGRSEPEAWLSVLDDADAAVVWGRVARDLARNVRSGAAVVELLRSHAARARAVRRGGIEKQARTVGVYSVVPLTTCFLPAFILVGVVPIIAGLASSFRF